jgi:polysaccharide export outer membrane protein
MTIPKLRVAGLTWALLPVVGLAMAVPAATSQKQQQPPPAAGPGRTDTRPAAREYIIGNDDVLEISVWENVAMSRTIPVRPDGRISLPIVNDVQAAGLTPMQLQAQLTTALEKFMKEPAVTVMVKEVHSFKVSVVGRVGKPGRYEFTNPVTVLEALAVAGGLSDFADRNGIVVIRRDASGSRMLPFAYERLASGRTDNVAQENYFVQNNDIVMVR